MKVNVYVEITDKDGETLVVDSREMESETKRGFIGDELKIYEELKLIARWILKEEDKSK